MASIALDPAYRRVGVDEFLRMNFHGAKAELEDGLIFMMAGGTKRHARVAARLIRQLGNALDGSGCEPFGSDFRVRTGERTVRYPDVSVYRDRPDVADMEDAQLAGIPTAVFEVLSPSTVDHDQEVKLPEYRRLQDLREIIIIDPASERVRVIRRDDLGEWSDRVLRADEDILLLSLEVSLSRSAIFARG